MIISNQENPIYPSEWKRIEGRADGVYTVLSYGLTDRSIDDYHAALVKDSNGYSLILDFDALRAAIKDYDQYGDIINNNTDFYGVFYITDPRCSHKGKIEHVWLRVVTGKGIGSLKIKKDNLGARINADHLVKGISKTVQIDNYLNGCGYVNLPVFWHQEEQTLIICFP
jgi:hypothetical protein